MMLGRVRKPPDIPEEEERPETSADISRVPYFFSSAIVASEQPVKVQF